MFVLSFHDTLSMMWDLVQKVVSDKTLQPWEKCTVNGIS